MKNLKEIFKEASFELYNGNYSKYNEIMFNLFYKKHTKTKEKIQEEYLSYIINQAYPCSSINDYGLDVKTTNKTRANILNNICKYVGQKNIIKTIEYAYWIQDVFFNEETLNLIENIENVKNNFFVIANRALVNKEKELIEILNKYVDLKTITGNKIFIKEKFEHSTKYSVINLNMKINLVEAILLNDFEDIEYLMGFNLCDKSEINEELFNKMEKCDILLNNIYMTENIEIFQNKKDKLLVNVKKNILDKTYNAIKKNKTFKI